MQITLEDKGGKAFLTQTTYSSTVNFTIPLSVDQLKPAIISFLKDVDARDTTVGSVMLTKNQSEIKIISGTGVFGIPFVNLFALLWDDA